MASTILIKAEFYFGYDNLWVAPERIKPKFRFSLWKDEGLVTSGEIRELIGTNEITPGETSESIIMVMNGKIAQGLKVGDILHWGAPLQPIGTIKVLGFK